MTTSEMDICFVALPFNPIERPMISFGLLQAILKKDNIKATTLYYNLDFAEKIGAKNYHIMSQFAYFLFGEWVFSKYLYSDTVNSDAYLKSFHELIKHSKTKPLPLFYDTEYLSKLRNKAQRFLKETAEDVIKQYNPKVVACSSIFDNLIACVSFFKLVKELAPETVTLMGGPNCQGEMGKNTHKIFPSVDYVISGYAENVITSLCRNILMYGKDMPADEVPDQVFAPILRETGYENNGKSLESQKNINLHEIPVPDYDDYFSKLNSPISLKKSIFPGLPIESSRGCYWRKCTFCGLKQDFAYRKKNWEQVYHEIITLTSKHKTKMVMFCDNDVHFNKLTGMLDKLTDEHLGVQMWAEIRVELKKEHLRKMKEAGAAWIQVGIESLNDNFLDCMRKGSTMLQNIQIIKWARQYGIHITYTLMYDFPFEKDKWYGELGDNLPLLVHLQPPRGMTKLRFDRFSDYYMNQSKYGLDLNALKVYSYIYPYDQETIDGFAYYFEDKKSHRSGKNPILHYLFGNPTKNFSKVNNIVLDWMKNFYSEAPFSLMYEITGDGIAIHDTRPGAFKNDFLLKKLEGEVLLFTDEARSVDEIHIKFGNVYRAADVDDAVRSLIDKKVALKHKNKILALALEPPLPAYSGITDIPWGHVI